jgi:transcriptional regulator NrdR family protein
MGRGIVQLAFEDISEDLEGNEETPSIENIGKQCENVNRGIEAAFESLETLGSIRSIIANSKSDTLDSGSLKIIRLTTENIKNNLKLHSDYIKVAVESISDNKQVALEGIGSFFKGIWDAIVNAFKWVWRVITGFFRTDKTIKVDKIAKRNLAISKSIKDKVKKGTITAPEINHVFEADNITEPVRYMNKTIVYKDFSDLLKLTEINQDKVRRLVQELLLVNNFILKQLQYMGERLIHDETSELAIMKQLVATATEVTNIYDPTSTDIVNGKRLFEKTNIKKENIYSDSFRAILGFLHGGYFSTFNVTTLPDHKTRLYCDEYYEESTSTKDTDEAKIVVFQPDELEAYTDEFVRVHNNWVSVDSDNRKDTQSITNLQEGMIRYVSKVVDAMVNEPESEQDKMKNLLEIMKKVKTSLTTALVRIMSIHTSLEEMNQFFNIISSANIEFYKDWNEGNIEFS